MSYGIFGLLQVFCGRHAVSCGVLRLSDRPMVGASLPSMQEDIRGGSGAIGCVLDPIEDSMSPAGATSTLLPERVTIGGEVLSMLS